MRAYYRDSSAGDLSLPHDSGRAVPEEKLQALGLKFWTFKETDEDLKEKFKTIAEEMGFVEGDSQSISWELGSMEPKAIEELVKSYNQDTLLLTDFLSCFRRGSSYYDFKDPETNDYIRFVVGPGALFAPRGTIVQFSKAADIDIGLMSVDEFYKTSEPLDLKELPVSQGQDLPSHPFRISYLASIGLA